jgi:transposase
MVATRHNAASGAFCERLCAAGKAGKLASIACPRKLLLILNAMLRDQTPRRAVLPALQAKKLLTHFTSA